MDELPHGSPKFLIPEQVQGDRMAGVTREGYRKLLGKAGVAKRQLVRSLSAWSQVESSKGTLQRMPGKSEDKRWV